MGTSRTYSDPSFGSKKMIKFKTTGSLAGTAAIAVKEIVTLFEPIVVTDMEVFFTAGGTSTAQEFVIGGSLAGTGTFAACGTIVVGTQATGTVKDGSVTETAYAAGDDLILYAGGTGAILADGVVSVAYREAFVSGNENG